MTPSRLVSLTGIKPTGTPHIGNLFGAILPAIELTKRYAGVYFIADLHALTTETDGDRLRSQSLEVAATWLALGLDVEDAVFFKQSDVPEVCELAWMLSCFTGIGLLNRAHAYKDALDKGLEPNHGLFAYPVLMAADILLYETNVVPVGKDQKQHVEICRDIAQRLNDNYKDDLLVIPEPIIQENVAVIPGLDGRKMSKSYGNTIEIFLPPNELEKKFKKIVTGSEGLADPKDPATCNVFALHKLLVPPADSEAMAAKYRAGGYGYGAAKKALFEAYEDFIKPHRKRYEELLSNRDHVATILARGRDKARVTATRVLDRLRRKCGFTS